MTRDPGSLPAIRSLSVVPIARDPDPITRWVIGWVITPVIIRGRPIIDGGWSVIDRRGREIEEREADGHSEAIMAMIATIAIITIIIPRGRRACCQQQGQ
jgi:hypothetical protein